jgi:esterase
MPMRLHSHVSGSGRPVLILHGLFGSSGNWQSIARRLAPSFCVHALDLRNHGASPWFTDMSYPAMAADVAGYMSHRGVERAMLVGHSMGGKAAMELALSAPGRVESLLVLDIAPCAYDRAHDHILESMLSVNVGSVASREEADGQLAASIPDPRVRQFLLTNLRRKEGGGFAWRLNLEAIAASYERLLEDVGKGRTSDVVALFLRGGRSDHVGPPEERAIVDAFPRAKVETVQDAGHWLGADAPDAVVDAVRRLSAVR